jgi:ElaB/YqjD/DUF883 family membrane-anchored ribosome-binding protein
MAETVQHPRASRAAPVEEAEVVRDLETLKAEIATLKLELEKVTQAAKDVGSTALGAAKDQGAIAIDRVKAEAEALADSVVAQGRSQIAGLEERVREQPLMALGLAFGAGLLFAKLSGR